MTGVSADLTTDTRPELAAELAPKLYLDLLKRCLLNLIYEDLSLPQINDSAFADTSESLLSRLWAAALWISRRRLSSRVAGYTIQKRRRRLEELGKFDRQKRLEGKDFPSRGHTMIGMRRLDNIQTLVENILLNHVPGDLIETGVWRGGATILMRGILKVYGVTDRTVWVADSFAGMPKRGQDGMSHSFSSSEYASWPGTIRRHPLTLLAIAAQMKQGTSYDAVRDNFARYGLLDDQVQFLAGWFHETLPAAPITRLALLRLDGDLYDSTHDALKWLYPKLSVGGYVIVDDYGTFSECRRAIHDYLDGANAQAELQRVDEQAVYWQKT
jgi:hypothetical protein